MRIKTLLFLFWILTGTTFSQSNFDTTHLIVRLNFKLLDWSVVDDDAMQSGKLIDFLSAEGAQHLKKTSASGFDLSNLMITKSFSFLKTKDSLSVGRQGNVVYVPPFWATFSVAVPEGLHFDDFLKELKKAAPIVVYAHPKYQLEYFSTPNDTLFTEQKSLYSDSAGINMDSAWTINTGENWVKVGVFDTGIDTTHPDLNVLTGWMSSVIQGASWGEDLDGHGTQVAGIIGAKRNNTVGVAGIAGGDGSDTSGVRLLDFRNGLVGIEDVEFWCASIVNSVRSPGTYFDWGPNLDDFYDAYYYDHAPGYGVHVNNFSSGFRLQDLEKGPQEEPGPPEGPSVISTCFLCQEAFLFSIQNGVLSTASRGNPTIGQGVNPNSYEGPRIYPAGFHDSWVMSTGSSGYDGERLIQGVNTSSLYFSPLGQGIDVIAPGSFETVYTTESSAVDTALYGHFDGTSAAAPHVAGVAALLIGHYNKPCYSNVNLDPADLEYIIEQSATQTQENIDSNGYHPGSGWGRLNAFEALKMIDFPEYQIVHPQGTYTSRQTVETDTISINYVKPLSNYGLGPLGAGFPLLLNFPYKVVRIKEQVVYNFGQYMLDSTVLLDAWVRHGQTNSAIRNEDTVKSYIYSGTVLQDSMVTGSDFGIEQMAVIDSIVNDSLIYLSGYYYHFVERYLNNNIEVLLYTNASDPVEYWYPINPFLNEPKMAYSIYIHDTTLLTRYDFPCDSLNDLIDVYAAIPEQTSKDFEVYPNPGSTVLNIVLDHPSYAGSRIVLVEASGRIVQEIKIAESKWVSLSVNHLNSGLYFVNLICADGTQKTKKWIKQ